MAFGLWYAYGRGAHADVIQKEGGKDGTGGPPPVSITAAKVRQKDVPYFLDGLGTVQAYSTVTIHSQVDGQIAAIHFKEGQDVHKGDLLAEVDPRSFQAQVDQAIGKQKQDEAKKLQDAAKKLLDQAKKIQDLASVNQSRAKKAQDDANLSNARVNLKRYESELTDKAVAEQIVSDQRAQVTQLEATVKGDEAALEFSLAAIEGDDATLKSDDALIQSDEAAIQADEAGVKYAQTFLSYTAIKSPLDGRIGVRLVDAGNIVHSGDTNGIVVITQLEPISILFTLPQQDLPAIQDRMAVETLQVLAMDTEGKTEVDRGKLELVDNQIDTATGTIHLKATFPNQRRRLWPGGFSNVRLLLMTHKDAAVAPASAVQQGPHGTFVYFIKPDNTVEMRPVKVALVQDGDAILESGVVAGDSIVLTGHDKLKSGSAVTVGKPKEAGEKKDGAEKEKKPEHEKKSKGGEAGG